MPDGDGMGEGDCWGGPIGEGVWGGGIGEDWGEGLVIPPRSTSSFYFGDLKDNPIRWKSGSSNDSGGGGGSSNTGHSWLMQVLRTDEAV